VRVTPQGSTGFAGGLDDIVGLDIHTNMTQTGFLVFGGDGVPGSESERAAAVLAGINSMTLQSQRTNVAAYIPTDCPTREKHVSRVVTAPQFCALSLSLASNGFVSLFTRFFCDLVLNLADTPGLHTYIGLDGRRARCQRAGYVQL
jgi:hypothetical protein